MTRLRLTPFLAAVLTVVYLAVWRGLVFFVTGEGKVDLAGWAGAYVIGLGWAVYLVERAARRIEDRRVSAAANDDRPPAPAGRGGNPLDPASRFYGLTPSLICFLLFFALSATGWAAILFLPVLTLRYPWIVSEFGKDAVFNATTVVTVLAMLSLSAAMAESRRLRQTLAMLGTYSLLFILAYLLAHFRFGGGDEIESDLPAGGGTDSIKPTSVKVQKVVRKKYVINPYSSILFAAPPPIDKIELKLTEETANQYKAGSGLGGLGKGDGKGGGFGSGTARGRWELVRLRHSDKGWDKNFGIGGDRNLLAEIKVREPLVKIPDDDQSVDYATLARYSPKKPLALLYVGGMHTFAPTAAERKILREYLIDKHGMILGDCLGGQGFHGNFIAVMNDVTGVTPVPIPRDDRIHQSPYALPQLPIVVAHGGTVPLGWKVDGRWVAYYHPGALSDAWRDDHAGIKREVWELCYQLGINILYYAYSEQDQWRQSRQP